MQFHALSLAEDADMDVDFVAYRGWQPKPGGLVSLCLLPGSHPYPQVESHPHIHQHLLHAWSWNPAKMPRIALLPLKALYQLFQLLFTLLILKRPDVILLQVCVF